MNILNCFLNIIIAINFLNFIVVDSACLHKIQHTTDMMKLSVGYKKTPPNYLNKLASAETTNEQNQIITTTITDCTIVSYYCQDRNITQSMRFVCNVKFDSKGCFNGCSCLIDNVEFII